MENSFTAIERLYQKVETYCKTTLELLKYESAEKLIMILSNVIIYKLLSTVLVFSILFLSAGLALFVGNEMGEIYYGFLAVGGLYMILLIVLFLFRDAIIKNPVSNFVISKLKTENIL